MELNLSGKVAMISGASKGLGKAIAYAFADEGVKLSICARNEKQLAEIAADIRAIKDVEVIYTVADMKNEADIQQFVKNTIEKYERIDILINNAGSAPPGDFLEMKDEIWEDAWRLKFLGYMKLSREVFLHMKKQQNGRIINIIGTGGRQPMKDYMVGGHINAGLLNFTKLLANEGAPYNILTAGINPGPIKTDRWVGMIAKKASLAGQDPESFEKDLLADIPLKRLALPEEVADLVTFLSSERASYITGTTITIDGGMTTGI